MSVGFLEVAGGRLWYEEAGEGPTIVLLHAEAADSRMWDAQWEGFAERFHTVRLDLPGCGRSPYPAQEWDASVVLERLLDRLGVYQAALIGSALGGTLAVDFAIEHPDRVWAVIAASVSPYAQGDSVSSLRAAEVLTLLVAGRPGKAAELYVDVCCPVRTSPGVDRAIQEMVRDNIAMLTQVTNGRMRLSDWWAGERAREIAVPTLVMWGDKDEPAAQSAAQRLATSVRHAVAMVLPGVDHLIPLRAPELFTAKSLEFLRNAVPVPT